MTADGVVALLEQFRTVRREFQRTLERLPDHGRSGVTAPSAWGAREILIHLAAWLNEANDRIPRLLAGAPSLDYDVDAFNAAAVERADGWSFEQALGAFRRAADRFETIVSESDAAELAAEPPVMAWLQRMAHESIAEHSADIERLIAVPTDRASPATTPRSTG